MNYVVKSLHVRFDRYVKRGAGCWEWNSAKISGYAVLWDARRKNNIHASRIAYERYIGVAPPHLFVCHSCDNPGCVNPKHLFLGTAKDNALDSSAKKRRANQRITVCKRGHPLTDENVYYRKRGNGLRECKTCARLIHKKWIAAHPGYNYAAIKKYRAKRRALGLPI